MAGLAIGVLSCIAGYLALPQFQAYISLTPTLVPTQTLSANSQILTPQPTSVRPSTPALNPTRALVTLTTDSITPPLVISSFPAPGKEVTGITWDGQNLWLLDYTGTLFKLDTSGKSLASFSITDRPLSLAWDGTHFWMFRSFIVGPPWDVIEAFQPAKNEINVSSSREFSVRKDGGLRSADLEWAETGLWYSDPSQYQVYLLNPQAEILKSFTVAQPVMGLAWDGGFLWLAYQADAFSMSSLHRVDTDGNGSLIVSTPITAIEGLAWGERVLWVIGHNEFDGPIFIYQLDLTRAID